MSLTLTPLRLGPENAGMRLSREEYASAETAEPWIYERAKGRLVVMPPPGADHRRISKPFRRELGLYWGLHPEIVDEVDYEGWVATSEDDDRIPDICLYLVGPTSGKAVPERVPDTIYEFVIEGGAARHRDFVEKRAEYHRIGVARYVVVDRFEKRVHVLTWQPGDDSEQVLSFGDVYTNPQLPGLRIELQEPFAD